MHIKKFLHTDHILMLSAHGKTVYKVSSNLFLEESEILEKGGVNFKETFCTSFSSGNFIEKFFRVH